ncbi:MAG: hypothetical protein KDD92_19235 [Caldilineaceae bacterium]|nr:hypothetical protein [Caldilineaceae bacterium]
MNRQRKQSSSRPARPPLRWTGILFAAAVNTLLVSAVQVLLNAAGLGLSFELFATMIAPLAAGVITALYVKQRGGMHATLGGLLSIPLVTYFAFGGIWQFGVLAGAFCGLAGTITEILTRSRQ